MKPSTVEIHRLRFGSHPPRVRRLKPLRLCKIPCSCQGRAARFRRFPASNRAFRQADGLKFRQTGCRVPFIPSCLHGTRTGSSPALSFCRREATGFFPATIRSGKKRESIPHGPCGMFSISRFCRPPEGTSLENESNQLSKKARLIIMAVAAVAIGIIHLAYIRPRYGDSLPIILFQFFPLYFLWKILFGEKKEEPKNTGKKKGPAPARNKPGRKTR